MKKLSIPQKSIDSLVLLSLLGFLSVPQTFADSLYSTYTEVGVAYNITNQNSVIDNKYLYEQPLYGNSVISYHLETGIKVPIDNGNTFKIGLYWYDLLNQDSSSKMHRPYKLEVFSDYVWNFSGNTFASAGVGYKVLEQTEINYKVSYIEREVSTGNNPTIDKITARFSVGKRYGNYTVSLDHHSQWLKGRPFNDKWEYHVTYLGVSYTF